MAIDQVIIFENIPKEFKKKEKLYVVQYEFSGIQSFIFGDVNRYSTRSDIAGKSKFIADATDSMDRWLSRCFSKMDHYRVLSKSSGKLICALSHHYWNYKKIRNNSDQLQRIIYASSQGKLEMFYGICQAKVAEAQEGLQEKNIMGNLALEVNRNKFHCTNLLGNHIMSYQQAEFMPCKNNYKADIISDKINKSGIINNKMNEADIFKDKEEMVAIKFDLDNLGSFFQKVTAFDQRKAASESLAYVLDHAFDGIDGVYPIFIGGDDIFAIARMDQYLHVASKMHENIKKALESREELADYLSFFGVSGGISIIRNDLGKVPLIYYFEESEEKLMEAKEIAGKNVFAAGNLRLNWEQLKYLDEAFQKYRKSIYSNLTEQQKWDLLSNPKKLKDRILTLHKNRKFPLRLDEESCHAINTIQEVF